MESNPTTEDYKKFQRHLDSLSDREIADLRYQGEWGNYDPNDSGGVSEFARVGGGLDGSVRRASNRIRVTGQLIDTLTGNHIWAERYDRVLEDIFAVQEEVT